MWICICICDCICVIIVTKQQVDLSRWQEGRSWTCAWRRLLLLHFHLSNFFIIIIITINIIIIIIIIIIISIIIIIMAPFNSKNMWLLLLLLLRHKKVPCAIVLTHVLMLTCVIVCYFQRSWEKLPKWPTQFGEIFSPFFCLVEEILNPKRKWKQNSQKILAPFIPVKMAHWEKGC